MRRNRLTPSETSGLVVALADVRDHVGEHLGYTEWREMEQDRVNRFADVTEDHNFIHVDVERAKASPFGGTIAHGYLTLSLVAPILGQLLKVSGASVGVNYGLDRVRFPAPLPVGREWRGGVELIAVDDVPGGLQAKLRVTIEVKGSEKPAMVADCLIRLFG
jgi:acyl dehydratase